MAQVNFNDVAMEKFSGNEPEADAGAFLKQVEDKIKVTLGQLPAPVMIEKTIHSVNEHFLHLYFADQQQNGTLPRLTKMTLPTRGTSKKENFVHVLLMVEIDIDFEFRLKTLSVLKMSPSKHTCKELKKIVDKGWPTIYVVGATAAQRTAADNQMQIHRNEKYISLGSKGLIPNSLKQCAYKRMLEHPNTTWEQLATHLINKNLCFAMSAYGAEPSSSKDKLVKIEKQLKSLQQALQSHSVNAVNLNPQNP